MRPLSIAFLLGIIILLGGGIYFTYQGSQKTSEAPVPPVAPTATDFVSCADLPGSVIMESYPRQCRTKEGQNFTEIIEATTTLASTTSTTLGSTTEDRILVTSPANGQKVTSPLTVTGEARGTWYFEASFPVQLVDANGIVVAQIPAQAKGDWMTENFVPYIATLTWTTPPATATGTLILKKDNPSGLPQNEASITIPISF